MVEAQYAGSKKQFLQYYQIALRSAKETEYWLRLANEMSVIPAVQIEEILKENIEIVKILTTSLHHGKNRQ